MLDAIIAIATGVLLLSHFWMRGSGGGDRHGALTIIGAVVGLIALVLGLLGITSVVGVALFVGGLMLLLEALRSGKPGAAPSGDAGLGKLAATDGTGRTIVGILLLVMGVVILIRVADADRGDGRWRWRGEARTQLVG